MVYEGTVLWITVRVLLFAVMFVNGFGDAPNAVATCVSGGTLSVKSAVRFAALMNFFGVLAMSVARPRVTDTICRLVCGAASLRGVQITLCAALMTVALWSTAAWCFGLPVSGSHALIAALVGGAVAVGGRPDGAALLQVAAGLVISTVGCVLLGAACRRLLWRAGRHAGHIRVAQLAAGGATAFLNGVQDGQKFMGIYLLGVSGGAPAGGTPPFWAALIFAAVLSAGTVIGGRRILRSVGQEMGRLTVAEGLSADLAAGGALLICSAFGMPVSVTNTKTSAMMGAGAGTVDRKLAGEMVAAWVCTIPFCALFGYEMTRVFFRLFS